MPICAKYAVPLKVALCVALDHVMKNEDIFEFLYMAKNKGMNLQVQFIDGDLYPVNSINFTDSSVSGKTLYVDFANVIGFSSKYEQAMKAVYLSIAHVVWESGGEKLPIGFTYHDDEVQCIVDIDDAIVLYGERFE